ncbi:MAG: hypothetical protein AAGJ81_13690 [Verrucomicrobiota bacterium]
MRTLLLATTIAAVLLSSGCAEHKRLVVSKEDFNAITEKVFPPFDFQVVGQGESLSGSIREFHILLRPTSENIPLVFDFTAWNDWLSGKDNFTGVGRGGSQGLYWNQTWRSEKRVISVDAVAMKNGTIKASYLEIPR